jgi:hypothetical protein
VFASKATEPGSVRPAPLADKLIFAAVAVVALTDSVHRAEPLASSVDGEHESDSEGAATAPVVD